MCTSEARFSLFSLFHLFLLGKLSSKFVRSKSIFGSQLNFLLEALPLNFQLYCVCNGCASISEDIMKYVCWSGIKGLVDKGCCKVDFSKI